jgi:ADP-heptose:LPS heptosyltransferase
LNDNIKNILIYNPGGGMGDTIAIVPIIQWLKKKYQLNHIYYIQSGPNKYFKNSCKDIFGNFVRTLDNLPDHFGFFSFFQPKSFSHIKIARNLSKDLGMDKFDVIIDMGTRVKNTLVVKQIPHKFFISPSMYFALSNPKKIITKPRHVIERIFCYFESVLKTKIEIPFECENIPKKYSDEAKRILKENNKYLGFSITAGHPTRQKEFSVNEIIKVANHFSEKNYVPVFFVEDKYKDLIENLKKNVKNVTFPEHLADQQLRNPLLVIALAQHMQATITIDNGIMHMLSLSSTKIISFFSSKSFYEKFRPLNNVKSKNYYMKNNKSIAELKAEEIINFSEEFI